MFTNLTFKLIHISLKFAYYFTGTRFYWNSTNRKVELKLNTRWTQFEQLISVCVSLFFGSSALVSYYIHLAANGLNLDEFQGIRRVGVLIYSSFAVLFVLAVQIRSSELCSILNTAISISSRYQEQVGKKPEEISRHQKLKDGILTIFVVNCMVLLIAPQYEYIKNCEKYFLDIIFSSQICVFQQEWGEEHGLTRSLFLWFQFIGLIIFQASVLAHARGMYVVVIAIFYPTLFSIWEILNDLSSNLESSRLLFNDYIKVYKELRILILKINSNNFGQYILPGHIALFSIAFIIGLRILLNESLPITAMYYAAGACLMILSHFTNSLTLFWRITAVSEELLRKIKLRAIKEHGSNIRHSSALLLELRVYPPLKFQMGFIGHFDQKLYKLLGILFFDATVNVLLL